MISERAQEAFLDLTRPPQNYKLTYCIGTTFTLELPCLVQMALNSNGNRKEINALNVHEGFELISNFASKSIVFTQNCKIKALPKDLMNAGNAKKGKFFSLLDSMVAEIPPETYLSAFHPKVWFLRFDPIDGNLEPIFKQFTMSRNLTSALNWDISICLVGKATQERNQNLEFIDFLNTLAKKSSIRKSGSKIVQKAIEDLSSVEFDLPKGQAFKDQRFSYKWGRQKPFEPLDFSACKRAVVISPFLSEKKLQEIVHIKNLYLITSSRDLNKINEIPNLHNKTYILNIDRMDLHAKMYLLEYENHSEIILGSTNFTNSGWSGNNVEANTILKVSKNTVEKFISDFIIDSKGIPNNWLKKFELVEDKSAFNDDNVIEKEMDEFQGRLATGEFILTYNKGTVTLSYDEDNERTFAKNFKGTVSIIGLSETLKLEDVLNGKAYIKNVKIKDLSSFLVINVKYKGKSKEFCTVALSNFDRLHRNKTILESTIKDWQSFWDYLGVILNTDQSRFMTRGEAEVNKSSKSKIQKRRNVKWRYLEPILLSGTSDPDMIKKIESGISALKINQKNITTDVELKSFLAFWKEYKLAFQEFKRNG